MSATEHAASQMTAIACRAPKDYRAEQVARPRAGRNERVIRIAACGICASDCKCWSGAKMFSGGPNPWVKAPVIRACRWKMPPSSSRWRARFTP